MLIEVFTNGRVMIDGVDAGKHYNAADVLYDYLTRPEGFLEARNASRKKKVA